MTYILFIRADANTMLHHVPAKENGFVGPNGDGEMFITECGLTFLNPEGKVVIIVAVPVFEGVQTVLPMPMCDTCMVRWQLQFDPTVRN